MRRRTEGERGLVNDTVETQLNQASASVRSVDDFTSLTVTGDKRQAGHHHGYEYDAWAMFTSVFKLENAILDANTNCSMQIEHGELGSHPNM